MGVPAFGSIKTCDLQAFLDDLSDRGIVAERSMTDLSGIPASEVYRCSRTHSKINIWFDTKSGSKGQMIVIVPRPPYQLAIWRWLSDYRLFDDVLEATYVREFVR